MKEIPETFEKVIKDDSINDLSFNIMPEKNVREKLFIKEYRCAKNYIEVEFSREYFTDMINSPSHLIFLSPLIQCQKLLYVYFCYYKNIEYSPDDERFKIWPTNFNIRLPELVKEEKNLVQRFWVNGIKQLPDGNWFVKCETEIGAIKMTGDALILAVEK
ncbi:hypothetical protein [Algibacter lectus]|uniref:Uncharacterized protein n=1 Tax=Algibacter lectus TaxID=221126 RepID=A0A090X0S0_9FLAO|nr:hypothetical protein [Algibacter lectus]GAL63754.1 hypothetical protein JCM19300_2790 [Algibacter lectus]GAL82203.1 hypothetical protein JCM19274_4391 [Algibacter lectus]SFB92125.1 hypothetical protein SAMN04489722_101267 [Algibacter lectus]